MKSALTLAGALVLSAAAIHAASDWPQWQGPDRTGISKETGLLKEWPKEGPKLVWKVEGLGEGYSTPSVAQGKLFVVGTVEKEECVMALDVKDGQRIWSTPIGKPTGGYPCP